jgi:hypothetical protein
MKDGGGKLAALAAFWLTVLNPARGLPAESRHVFLGVTSHVVRTYDDGYRLWGEINSSSTPKMCLSGIHDVLDQSAKDLEMVGLLMDLDSQMRDGDDENVIIKAVAERAWWADHSIHLLRVMVDRASIHSCDPTGAAERLLAKVAAWTELAESVESSVHKIAGPR